MVKRGIRKYVPVPRDNLTQQVGNLNAAYEKLIKAIDAGGEGGTAFYGASKKGVRTLYKNTGTTEANKRVINVETAYRDYIRAIRDIQKGDEDALIAKYGDEIKDTPFYQELIGARKYKDLSDKDIDALSFFSGANTFDAYAGRYEAVHNEINEHENTIFSGLKYSKFGRNPKGYWDWVDKKADWQSNQPGVSIENDPEIIEEDKQIAADKEWENDKAKLDAWLNVQDTPDFDKWIDGLSPEDQDYYFDIASIQNIPEKARTQRQQKIHEYILGWGKQSPKVEEKPINTPAQEEPVNDETRGSDTTTDVKGADKKDDLKKDAETVINQDKRREKILKNPYHNSDEENEYDYNDVSEPDLPPPPKKEERDVHYPKIDFGDKDSKIVATKAFKRGDAKMINDVFQPPADEDLSNVKFDSVSEREGYPDLEQHEREQKNKKERDMRKAIEGNAIPDQRLYTNKGRETNVDGMRRPKANPTDIEKDPSKGGMPIMSPETKLTYTQPVLVPQYSQPTNVHNLLSFDYALTTNAEYMRSKIQEANNKMFPRKDLSDVKKMRKLRIDNNKNTALKGGMPMSAFFYR